MADAFSAFDLNSSQFLCLIITGMAAFSISFFFDSSFSLELSVNLTTTVLDSELIISVADLCSIEEFYFREIFRIEI